LKISYEAARRNISILELWIEALYRAYIDLRYQGDRRKAGLLDETFQTDPDILREATPKS